MLLFFVLQFCSLVSLQRHTKALSSVQRAFLVEKARQKPQESIRIVTDVNSCSHLKACFNCFSCCDHNARSIWQVVKNYGYVDICFKFNASMLYEKRRFFMQTQRVKKAFGLFIFMFHKHFLFLVHLYCFLLPS